MYDKSVLRNSDVQARDSVVVAINSYCTSSPFQW